MNLYVWQTPPLLISYWQRKIYNRRKEFRIELIMDSEASDNIVEDISFISNVVDIYQREKEVVIGDGKIVIASQMRELEFKPISEEREAFESVAEITLKKLLVVPQLEENALSCSEL